MSVYRIADLNISIENVHDYTDTVCKDYLTDENCIPDITAKADAKEMESDKLLVPEMSDGYLESLSIYRDISNKIIDFGGFILHSSIIEKDGRGFAFSAKSGTGKTTHSKLWLKRYSDAKIINGDKPLVRITQNGVFAYGTPWCGKEGYNINAKVPLTAICFLERGENNEITKLSKEDAVRRIFPQLLIPKKPEYTNKLLDLVEILIERVPAYLLKCNMLPQAAEVAYNGMVHTEK